MIKITTIHRLYFSIIFLPLFSWSQNYVSFFTGNPSDSTTSALGGVCLMGGSSNFDELF